MKHLAWLVYLKGKLLTTVYFTPDCDLEYVKKSLINHDGYDSQIEVVKRVDSKGLTY